MIDDSDEPSRAGTPKPVTKEGGSSPERMNDGETAEKKEDGEAKDDAKEGEVVEIKTANGKDAMKAPKGDSAAPSTASELPPEIKQKLRKLEKLEATYPGKYSIVTRVGADLLDAYSWALQNYYDPTESHIVELPLSNHSRRPSARTHLSHPLATRMRSSSTSASLTSEATW